MSTQGVKTSFLLSLTIAALAFAGCNGSSMSGGGTGTLNLAITDTPVDGAASVVVTFTGVEIQPADMSGDDSDDMDNMDSGDMGGDGMDSGDGDQGEDSGSMAGSSGSQALVFNFSAPRQIDLMQQQGGNSASLLSGVSLPAGQYAWIRLMVDASQSSITLADGSVHPLVIPSGDETGLKLVHGFTVAAGGQVNFTIDFDLRESITLANGKYILKPVLRITDNESVGEIRGNVSNIFMIGTIAVTDPSCSPTAYIYAGDNVTPVDINPTSTVQPVTTASLKLDTMSGDFTYTAAFLAPGDYTVALVCAAGDNPQTADSLTFSMPKNATVTADMSTEVDFP